LIGVTTGTGARLEMPPMPEVGTPGVQSLYLLNKVRKLHDLASHHWGGSCYEVFASFITYRTLHIHR